MLEYNPTIIARLDILRKLVVNKLKIKNKTHQELIKEIWDDADKSAMDILDEPIDLNVEDPFDNFFPPEKDKKQNKL